MSLGAPEPATLAAYDLTTPQDVFALRRIGQSAAEALGMDRQDQVRIATALSELGRDRLGCEGLTVSFALPPGPERVLAVVFGWTGGAKAAPDLDPASRLLHRVRHETGGGRERIVAEHPLLASWVDSTDARRGVVDALRRHASPTLADDLREQTRDLITALEETRAQREEMRPLQRGAGGDQPRGPRPLHRALAGAGGDEQRGRRPPRRAGGEVGPAARDQRGQDAVLAQHQP